MKTRFSGLRKIMKKTGIGALFVTNTLNIEYLTGLKVSVGVMVVTPKKSLLFVDRRYLEVAKKRAKKGVIVYDYTLILKKLHSLSSLSVEADSMTLQEFSLWKRHFKNKKLVQSIDLIKGLKRIKDTFEILKIQRASSITKTVLSLIPRLLVPGITEKALAARIEIECRKRGADGMAFDTIVGFGQNTSKPHHQPTLRRFRKGDVVQIDMGAKVEGYCSDFSRFFVTGTLTEFQRSALKALKEAKAAAERLLKPGVSVHKLDRAARAVLAKYGYEDNFPHALGHGVGMEIHDGIVLSQKKEDYRLKRGDVITIEPGIYFEGQFGIRIEDTHVIA